MHSTDKLGGRKKGTPNKDTDALFEKAMELEVDPFEVLLLFAKGDYKTLGYQEYSVVPSPKGSVEVLTISPEIRSKCAAKACEFLYPKRKAVEIKVDDETKKGLTLAYTDPKTKAA